MSSAELNTYSKVIVLTGCSGSGKSTVAGILEGKGARIVSADALSKLAVRKGTKVLEKLTEQLGPKILQNNGELDRDFLRDEIFADVSKRRIVESIIHPQVRADAITEMENGIAVGKTVIYDCPLYYESKLDNECFKAVIVVHAKKEDSLNRIIARDGLTLEQAELRYSTQIPSEEKIKYADYIINNSGTKEDLIIATEALWSAIKNNHK
jgi:dephospho-CoA kinase